MQRLIVVLFVVCCLLGGAAQKAEAWSEWTRMSDDLYYRIERQSDVIQTIDGVAYEQWQWQFRNAGDMVRHFEYGLGPDPGPKIGRTYHNLPPSSNSKVQFAWFEAGARTLYIRYRLLKPKAR